MKFYASYYKCALQVNPFSYSKYSGGEPIPEEKYNNLILSKCVSNNIKIVGLADHRKVDTSESLRKKLCDNNIVVFPGFEITTAEKIHIVCLFPPEKTVSELNNFLGACGVSVTPEENNTSSMTCLTIADKVNQFGGFWYAAHITSDNGILKIGQLHEIWKDPRVIAAQIPNSKINVDPNYLNIIKNKEPAYMRKHMLALINAKDIKSPEDLDTPTATVLVKMTEPSFGNFLTSFKDPGSRVCLCSERENNYQSSIKSVAVFGGYLDGLSISFSDNLTTIIGGRGTGKSTIINLIRYALELPIESSFANDFNKMIDSNLGSSGRIEIEVVSNSHYGEPFKIVRRYKQNPVITDKDNQVSNLAVKDILPKIEVYGQNEIMDTIASHEKVLNIVNRLFTENSTEAEKIKNASIAITRNSLELDNIENELETYHNNISDLPRLEECLKFYNEAGLSAKLSVIEKIATDEADFENFKNSLPSEAINLQRIPIINSQNEQLKELLRSSAEYNTIITKIMAEYKKAVQTIHDTFNKQRSIWEVERSKQDQEIKDSLQKIDNIQDKSSTEISSDYRGLIKQIQMAKPSQENIATSTSKRQTLLLERKTLIENFKVVCDSSDLALKKLLDNLNKQKLGGKVRLSLAFRQNKKKLLEKLKEVHGIGDNGLRGILEFNDFDIFTFVNDISSGVEKIKEKYALTQGVAEKIALMSPQNLRHLEQLQLKDIVTIELMVNGSFKKLEKLSKGQQCTAILNILLVDNLDPLIIDQPEDNLDNAFIAENLVETIRENKVKRQYIFATHNANIPVFGDAELIVAMDEVNNIGRIMDGGIGSIDSADVKKHVVQILEGGEAAFKMRERKYGIA